MAKPPNLDANDYELRARYWQRDMVMNVGATVNLLRDDEQRLPRAGPLPLPSNLPGVMRGQRGRPPKPTGWT